MAKRGRPPKLSQAKINKIKKLFAEYIDNNDIPIVAEFAYQNNISRDDLYNYEEFGTLLKKCTNKKEATLEKKALEGEVSTPMAIFSLKQLGWKDKHDIEHSGSIGVTIVDDIPNK